MTTRSYSAICDSFFIARWLFLGLFISSTRLEIAFIQIVGKCVIDSLHRELTIFSIVVVRSFLIFCLFLFRRQWKSISMLSFLRSSIVSLSLSRILLTRGTPCCVLEKTMIMFSREIFEISEFLKQ